ncbi:MAG TPA: DUF4337 family protein [Verrucomicrobiae bacterium]
MKTEIPDELKADVPPSLWGKILSATPVIMTVIATLLAGLASSEMTRAQYDRAYAAQLQSKAGDQWNYFQAKKLRGAIQRNSLELLRATSAAGPLNLTTAQPAGTTNKLAFETADQLLRSAEEPLSLDAQVKPAFDALNDDKPESEMAELLKDVNTRSLDDALKLAKDRTRAFDAKLDEITSNLDQTEQRLSSNPAQAHDFLLWQMDFNARRYEVEARLNQAVAYVYELQVRKSNLSAERHHTRSQKFFFGMLAAQAAVIIATLALAARKRSLLWSLAAGAGIAAVLFAIYVYLYV